MRIATIKTEGEEEAAVLVGEYFVPLRHINTYFGTGFQTGLLALIECAELQELASWSAHNHHALHEISGKIGLDKQKTSYAPLYRHPGKIWDIGLNYQEHAADLDEQSPRTEPASFMKPDTTIIAAGEPIHIPVQSERTTAEAELALIIGRRCKNIPEKDVDGFIAGYTTVVDVTAEDILRRNPRYLTRAKSFDTFFK